MQALAGASQVVFTDLPAILPVVESNVAHAAHNGTPTRVCEFEWCEGDAPVPIPTRRADASDAPAPSGAFDVVLAADLVYKSVRR